MLMRLTALLRAFVISISEAEPDEEDELDICDRVDSDTEPDSPGMSAAGY